MVMARLQRDDDCVNTVGHPGLACHRNRPCFGMGLARAGMGQGDQDCSRRIQQHTTHRRVRRGGPPRHPLVPCARHPADVATWAGRAPQARRAAASGAVAASHVGGRTNRPARAFPCGRRSHAAIYRARVVLKTGRGGALCFVTLDHAFTGPQGLVLTERHDIVYRAPRATRTPPPR